MSYLKDREIWLSKVPTGNPPAGFFWKFIQNGKVVVRDSSGNDQMMIATNGSQAITGSLIVTGGITGTISSASYVQYSNVANKPTLVSGSGQISFNGITNKPTLVSGSSQVTFLGLSSIPSGIVSGSSQVTYSGLTGIPSGIVSGSAQVAQFGYATTGANGFNGSQSITGSLTVTGQVIAQTLNVQQVTSSIVFSSGSNVFGNNSGNTHRFTGSVNITGSLSVNGALSGASATFSGNVTSDDLILTAGTLFGTGNTGFSNRSSDTTLYLQMPATGFNITDNALNTRFILSSAGAITSQTTGNNGIIKIGGSTYYSQLETNSTLGGLKIKSVWGAANSGIIQFINGTSENIRMHIADNGNVDVGLTNATDRLTISRNVADNAGGITLYNAETSGYGSALTFRVNYAGVYNVSRIHGDWGTGNSGLLHFFTANTSQTLVERMLIDGSGNVGIGTANPVANDGTSRTLQVGNRLVIQNVIGTQFLLGTNCYYDGVSWKYIAAAKAQAVRGTGESGAIQFSISPTGTVGGTITNMDGSDIKMIILDTGNVGIGTNNPFGILNARQSNANSLTTVTFDNSATIPASAGTQGTILRFRSEIDDANLRTTGAIASYAMKSTGAGTNNNGDLRFYTGQEGDTNERMRITSAGYLKASNTGTYLNGSFHEITSNTNDQEIFYNTHFGTSPYGRHLYFEYSPNNDTNYFERWRDGNATRARLYSNGGLANYQANNVNLSDERTKKDIEPLESYWDKFKAIEIVKFKYKDQTHDDFNIGVIAQQVEAIAPEFVDVDGWDTKPKLDEEGNEIVSTEEPLKSIYTADLYHATIKVLQEAIAKIEEQQTLIESLKSRIEILEQ